MANTPYPCNTCGHCYACVMNEDNPNYNAECLLNIGSDIDPSKSITTMGDSDCPYWIHWETDIYILKELRENIWRKKKGTAKS